MKRVTQRHKNGCGVAVLAMLTNHSYSDIYKLFKCKSRIFPGISLEDALRVLDKYKIKYRVSFRRPNWDRLDNNALIAINAGSFRHAVVWYGANKMIIDPSKHKKLSSFYVKQQFNYIIELI